MALIKRVLLFFLSLVGIIVLLVGATTSHAKDEFEVDIKEDNLRFFTMEWINVVDDNNRKYVCGTKVSTFDYTGRKISFEYYYLITKDNEIVTRFDVHSVQVSILEMEPLKTEQFKIKLYGAIISKEGEDLLAGVRGSDKDYKGIGTQFNELDIIGNTELFKSLYKGGYQIEIYYFPNIPKIITSFPLNIKFYIALISSSFGIKLI